MADERPTVMEVDMTEQGAEEAATAPAPQLAPLPLNLLSTIKAAQAQNGLRHDDFMRYRKHCTSRLQSLYKALKMQHGRTKYQKRKLDIHNITDVRHLHVLLFSAERAWAAAMELKKEAGIKGGGAGGGADPRKRHHAIGRLGKAVYWASELCRCAAARSDARGHLEAEAHAAWLGGSLLLEKESDWGAALARFSRAKKLWQELAKATPDLEGQSLCLAQIEAMEPNIRYCSYRLERGAGGGGEAAALAALAALAEGGEAGGPGMELLQSKLAALAAEAAQAAAASTSYLDWLGVRHPVRHERVKVALAAAAEFTDKAEQVMDSDGGDSLESRLALYDRAVNALAEAKSHVRNAVKGLAGPDSEAHFRELEALEGGVEGLRLATALRRTEAHLGHTAARFAAGLSRLALGKKIKDKERHARPEEVVRLLDGLSRGLEEMADLGARLGGRAGEALHEAAAARVAAAKALRTYHVAHALLAAAAADSKEAAASAASSSSPAAAAAAGSKALEAWALFNRAAERGAGAAAALAALPGDDAAAGVLLQGRAGLLAELAEMGRQAAAYKAVAQAEIAAAELRSREELQAGVGALSLDAQQQQQAAAGGGQPYLLDALDKWESFAGGAAAAATSGTAAAGGGAASKAPPRLYKGPYGFAAVPARPIMLDTAAGCLEYPGLEHRLRRAEKKSVLSSLFGWRR